MPSIDEQFIIEARRTLFSNHALRERIIWWKALIRGASSELFMLMLADLGTVGTEEFDIGRLVDSEEFIGMTREERIAFVRGARAFASLVSLQLEAITGITLSEMREKAGDHAVDQMAAGAAIVVGAAACGGDGGAQE